MFSALGYWISIQFAAGETKNRAKNENVESSLHLSAISFPFNRLRGKRERNATIRENKKDQKRCCETVKALSA
jgi:hypothetical protein